MTTPVITQLVVEASDGETYALDVAASDINLTRS